MRRRQTVAIQRNNVERLQEGCLYRFTYSDETYRPTTVVAIVTTSAAMDVLTVARVESYETNDTRPPLPQGSTLTLAPGTVKPDMIIPDQPIPKPE